MISGDIGGVMEENKHGAVGRSILGQTRKIEHTSGRGNFVIYNFLILFRLICKTWVCKMYGFSESYCNIYLET